MDADKLFNQLQWEVRRDEPDFDKIRQLVKNGADPNRLLSRGETPLVFAALNARDELAELLLELGADPNKADSLEQTALHKAAYMNNAEIVEILLRHGARADAKDYLGQTPRVKTRHPEIINLLDKAAAQQEENRQKEAARKREADLRHIEDMGMNGVKVPPLPGRLVIKKPKIG